MKNVITGVVVLFFTMFIMIFWSMKNIRDTNVKYIDTWLEVTKNTVCKTGKLTTEIDDNLRNQIDKIADANNFEYVITYKYQKMGTSTLENLYIDTTPLYIGDIVYIQFNLDIPASGATDAQLAMQPAWSKVVNNICHSVGMPKSIDIMLRTTTGLVENNYVN